MKSALINKICCIAFLMIIEIWPSEDLLEKRVGVVAFLAKNDVGTSDAGRVSALIVNNELKQIGLWKMLERIQLNDVLNEQSLHLLNGDSQAIQVGILLGANAMVSGSLMSIGQTKILTARMVDVQTGELLQSASVRFKNPEELEAASLKIAHLLSGESERHYFTSLTEKKLRKMRVSTSLGSGWGQTRIEHRYTDFNDNGKSYDHYFQKTQTDIAGLMLDVGFRSFYCDLDLGGVIPNHIGLLKIQAVLYPWTHLGFGGAYIQENQSVRENGFEYGTLNWKTYLVGFKLRANPQFSFGFYKGKSTEGQIKLRNPEFDVPTQNIRDETNILQGPTLATFELLFGENQHLNLIYYHNLESSPIFKAEHPKYRILTNHKIVGYSRMIGLEWGMNFAL
jgi:hypothetical protein